MIVFLIGIITTEIEYLIKDLKENGVDKKTLFENYQINDLEQELMEHISKDYSKKIERFFYNEASSVIHYRYLDRQLIRRLRENISLSSIKNK